MYVLVLLTFRGKNCFYVPETHIMYFIRRCWFLKCSEEIHNVSIGAGDMWYYVPVDDGLEEVLGCNVYARDNLRGQKSLGPLKMSFEMAHKVLSHKKKLCPTVWHENFDFKFFS